MADKQKQQKQQGKQAQAAPKKAEKKAETGAVASDEPQVKIPCRLRQFYQKEVVSSLMKKFNYSNVMQVPRLEKIVVNMGTGDAITDAKILEEAVKDLESITGQKPSVRKAKKAISNFKLRAGMNVGAKVTLRSDRMYEFLDRLINVSLPRVRDFRGLSDKSFDGRGNYTFGVKEQIIFPEIDVEKVVKVLGMDITFVTSAKTDEEAHELLAAFSFPFRKKGSQ
ncbi:MAG: 50S ribosomal protein L5 [Ignavibacteriaceae bacterium]|nr:50S ribosomal protein L5 [Ignavibacteriaceae bacterium]